MAAGSYTRTARPTAAERPAARAPTVWDWPLRLWHWALAACVGFSLYSGLAGDLDLLTWHQRSGLALVGLLVFRLGWAVWGGLYARFRHYWTTPKAFLNHFRGRGAATPHTAPGVALVVLMFLALVAQVGTGLFATDDIFNEGPLAGQVSTEFARSATWVHRRLHWLILGAVSVHLSAHAIYAFVLRDRTPLGMCTGRKPLPPEPGLPSTPHFWTRAIGTTALAAGAILIVYYAGRA